MLSVFFVCLGVVNMAACSWQEGTSSFYSTSLVNQVQGDFDRCEVIYPQTYGVMTPLLAGVMALWDEKTGEVKKEVKNETARMIVRRARTMLLNMMSSPTRPLHPIAFFAVVKDFESTLNLNWSGGGEGYDNRFFHFTTTNCSGGLCLGLFQINLALEKDPTTQSYLAEPSSKGVSENFAAFCGAGGLGLLGQEGSLDVCASLFWWLIPDKCSYMPEAVKVGKNLCTEPGHAWSPETFAYTYRDVYRQANQLERYGIYKPWVKFYEGGRFLWSSYDHNFMGYEHCAAKHYLKSYLPDLSTPSSAFSRKTKLRARELNPWVVESERGYDVREVVAGYPLNFHGKEAQKLIQSAVLDFAEEIGLKLPWQADVLSLLTADHTADDAGPYSYGRAKVVTKAYK